MLVCRIPNYPVSYTCGDWAQVVSAAWQPHVLIFNGSVLPEAIILEIQAGATGLLLVHPWESWNSMSYIHWSSKSSLLRLQSRDWTPPLSGRDLTAAKVSHQYSY